jgi:type II secretory pathway component PulF
METEQAFTKRIRAALSVPLITVGFFLAIMVLIFTFVIPQFASVFESMGGNLPKLTKVIFALSSFMLSYGGFLTAIALTIIIAGIWNYRRYKRFKSSYDALLMCLPYIKQIQKERGLTLFFNALGRMVQGGVPLTQALTLATATVHNLSLRQLLERTVKSVEEGTLLSVAFDQKYIQPDIRALLLVGEETGALGDMLVRAGNVCNERLMAQLSFFATIIQPLLLVIIALATVMLMLAVYVPILSLSYAVK